MINFGIFFIIIYPGAFVQFKDFPENEDVANNHYHNNLNNKVNTIQKLKIYCAGSWHNIFIAIIAYFILYFNPLFMKLFYYNNQGVMINSISQVKYVIYLFHNFFLF